ncbi:Uncharacterised protein [Vibrio cholerae]|nr:Uncharacterised protein [Vibrio cholerae]
MASVNKSCQIAAMRHNILAAILRRQNGTRFRRGHLDPRIGHHPIPVIKTRHGLTNDTEFFEHQLHAT